MGAFGNVKVDYVTPENQTLGFTITPRKLKGKPDSEVTIIIREEVEKQLIAASIDINRLLIQTDSTPQEKKPETKKPEEKKPEEKKPAAKKPEEKKPAEKKPEEKKPADKKLEEKKPAEKKPEEKKPADKNPEDKKLEEKKPEEKKPEEKKPEEKKKPGKFDKFGDRKKPLEEPIKP